MDADLERINQAGEAIAEDLFHAGFDRTNEYAIRFGLAETDLPLALANAYYRVALSVNASFFRLDDEVLGSRWMQAIKDLTRESSNNN